MPDIFGKMPEEYTIVRAMKEEKLWDRYQAGHAAKYPEATQFHDFDALGSMTEGVQSRATEDQSAVGFLTNNLLSIQTMIDEIMYTAYRLPNFIAINTNVNAGARTYGVRVQDRVGRADRISAPGYDAPSATSSEAIDTIPIHWYGLDAEWSSDELRGAMFAGHALDTYSIEAAVTGSLETMEAVGLHGGGFPGATGLINQPITGTGAVTRSVVSTTFAADTAQNVRSTINAQLSSVIETSRETLGRNVNTGMTVYLPGLQYDELSDKYIGDNAERTLMRSIKEDNPWTHFTGGMPLMIERLMELDSALNPGSTDDRMIVALKNMRVAEMVVSVSPRVLKIIDSGRVICAQIESKYSELYVKRPNTIHYVDQI